MALLSTSTASTTAAIAKPSRYLQHSTKHFEGYFVQLDTYIRRMDDAGDLLDGILINPLCNLVHAATEVGGADAVAIKSIGTLQQLYATHPRIMSTFPPSPKRFEQDPVGTIVDMLVATRNGTWEPADEEAHEYGRGLHTWLKSPDGLSLCRRFRAACKHVSASHGHPF